jgi:LemA protein
MKNKIFIGIIVLVVLIGLWSMSSYNSMVKGNLTVDTQWAQVEAQYQRRFDLIPSLVASVQGIMKQEKDVFTAIANARQGYAGARTVDERVEAAGRMEGALGRLLMITENYPQLNSNQAVKDLMTELAGTENRVSTERIRFNETVSTFNGSVMVFPSNIFAKLFGFEKRAFFKANESAAEMPTVKLN